MTNRLSSLQKYSQAAAQSAAALISHSFLGAAASSRVASRLLTGTKKAIISPQFWAACSAFLSASGHVFKFCGLFLRFKMVLQLCISLNSYVHKTSETLRWADHLLFDVPKRSQTKCDQAAAAAPKQWNNLRLHATSATSQLLHVFQTSSENPFFNI